MEGLTEWDIEQIERECNGNKKAGFLVETRTGLTGRVYNHEDPVNNKMVVHTEKVKLLCNPDTLKLKGFID
jgi:hypothetical protein